MEDVKNVPAKVEKSKSPTKEKEFNGYTMEELKYQRALLALRKEFSKEQMLQTLNGMKPSSATKEKGSSWGSKLAFAGGLAGKIFSNFNVLDYVMIGMSLFGTAKKAYSFFKGRK